MNFKIQRPLRCVLSLLGLCLLVVIAALAGFESILWNMGLRSEWSDSPDMGMERLNKIVADKDESADRKSQAIFSLFAHHVAKGPEKMRPVTIFQDLGWMTESIISINHPDISNTNVHLNPGDSHIKIFLYGKIGKNIWSIELCLDGKGGDDDLRRFFQGEKGGGFRKIREFTLTYPGRAVNSLGRTEFYDGWALEIHPPQLMGRPLRQGPESLDSKA